MSPRDNIEEEIFMHNSNNKGFLPKECLESTNTAKIVEPPKGQISAKAAFDLENQIAMEIKSNNINIQKQFEYLKSKGKVY